MKKDNAKKITSKQIVAIVGVAFLLLLYLCTLVAAFVDSSTSAVWFRVCLGGTVVMPLVIWLYSWMYGRLTGKRALGDPDSVDPAEFTSAEADEASPEQ